MRTKYLPWVVTALALSACSTNPYNPEVTEAGSQAPIEREVRAPQEDEAPVQTQPNQATLTLLASADEATAVGNHNSAITYLERAVRMQPRKAALWTRLAGAYLANDELVNATRHVRKAIALAAGDEIATRDAWLTMAQIKQAEGNINEARSIRRRWANVRG